MTASALDRATTSQQKASDPLSSTWVSANAGSGKTHVLANRVIRLLLEGTEPHKILCLTFTRAAAAEMSSRIFATLGAWVTLDDETLIDRIHKLSGHALVEPERRARARRLFARALETPGGLKVQTIHAFCESLLQRFPLEADIPPGFEVLDERSGRQLLADARAAVLSAAVERGAPLGDALKTVIAHLQPWDFDTVLDQILSRRREIAAAGPPQAIAARLRALHGLQPGDTAATIAGVAANRLDAVRCRSAAAVLGESGVQDQKAAERLLVIASQNDTEQRFNALRDLFLTKSLAPRKDVVTKGFAKKHSGIAEWLGTEQEVFAAVYELYRAAIICTGTEALLTIADAVLVRHEERKRTASLLDYDDLIHKTLNLLTASSAAWVLYKLDGGLDHILVDEAQDTSPEQWQVIASLAEEFFAGEGARDVVRTVFAVGDEKQSIFSFQGADPSNFDRMRAHFQRHVTEAQTRFDKVPLTVSFRSTSIILKAVDLVFSEPGALKGLTQGAEPPIHEVKRAGQPGLVEIWPALKPGEDDPPDPWDAPLDWEGPGSPRTQLAENIAETISRWLESREMLASRNRPIEPGDILILVRRRNAFVDAVVRALKRRNIPVAGADRLVLTGHIAIMDLLALAQFVLLPDDDLTLATVLKSPLLAKSDGAAFNDDDLFALARGRQGSLWSAVQQQAGLQRDLAPVLSLLKAWRKRADWQHPYEFFTQVLGPDRARRRFVERLGTETNDPIDEFLNLTLQYERSDVPSLQGFVEWMTSADTDIKRDMEHGTNEVRVMTVHGAKGLEANVVFLPDTCAVPAGQNDPKIMLIPDTNGDGDLPVWAIAKSYETAPIAAAREANRSLRAEEYNRLLYVAMTRACDRLYICGYETKRGRQAGCWYDLITQALAPHAREITGAEGDHVCFRLEDENALETADDNRSRDARYAPEPPPDWTEHAPAPEPPAARQLAPSRLDLNEDSPGGQVIAYDEQPVLSPLAGADTDRFRRGKLIHTLLQTLPDMPSGERGGHATRYLAGSCPTLSDAARAEIVAAVQGVLDHADFAPLFGPESRPEVPIAARLPLQLADGGEIVVSGQVDRLVVTKDEVLIVDYKTNRPAPVDIARTAPAYIRQIAAYRLALATLFPDRIIRAFLLWTDGPSLMEIPADLLDRALPQN